MERPFLFLLVFFTMVGTSPLYSQSPSFYESANYENLCKKALALSPQVKAIRAALEVAKSEIRTASLGTVSEIEFEVEDFGLDGSSLKESEMTLMWSKEIEQKGLRSSRIALARMALLQEKARAKNELLSFLEPFTQAYLTLAGKSMKLTLATENVALAQEILASTKNRVQAGAAPGLEKDRSQMEYDRALINKSRAKNALKAAQMKLASFLDCSLENISLPPLSQPSPLEKLSNKAMDEIIEDHPLVESATLAVERARIQRELIRRKGRTTVRAMAGFRRAQETADKSFLLGIGFSPGVRRRNKSANASADQTLAREKALLKETITRLKRRITEALVEVEGARAEFASVENYLLPAAERIFTAVKEGYLRGELKYTDMLVAKQSLVNVSEQRVQALLALHQALLKRDIAKGGTKNMKNCMREVVK